jgi:hypothetical protein
MSKTNHLQIGALKKCYTLQEKVIFQVRNESKEEIWIDGVLEIFLDNEWQEIESSVFKLMPRAKKLRLERISHQSQIVATFVPSALFYFGHASVQAVENRYRIRILLTDDKGGFKKLDFDGQVFTVEKECRKE